VPHRTQIAGRRAVAVQPRQPSQKRTRAGHFIATGQYLGEGFDRPQVDTLFLAFPLSFKDKLIQYVGRALRSHADERSVRVYGYVVSQVRILRKMCGKREKTYRSLSFFAENVTNKESLQKGFGHFNNREIYYADW
jgi:superfamily II DNA or RNA helicase